MSWKNPHGKCCLNCAFWQGDRKSSAGYWEANSNGDRGKCAQKVYCSVTSGPRACQSGCDKFVELSAR